MPGADNADDQRRLGPAAGLGDGLGHGAVPGELRLDEPAERRVLLGGGDLVVGDLGHRRGHVDVAGADALLDGEHTGERIPVGLGRRRRIAEPGALVGRNRGPAVASDPRDHRPVDVERHHRQPVLAGEVEQRQIEAWLEPPDLGPRGFGEELLHRQLAPHPAVEGQLHTPRKHLEADDHVGLAGVQGGQRVELPAVVLGGIVALAQQNDGVLSRLGDQRVMPGGETAQRVDPLPRNSTRRRMGRAVGQDRSGEDGGENEGSAVFHGRERSCPARSGDAPTSIPRDYTCLRGNCARRITFGTTSRRRRSLRCCGSAVDGCLTG